MPESDRLNYFSEVETLVNRPLTPEPRLVTVAAIATATPEAIMAYSMAVAPRSSDTNLFINELIAFLQLGLQQIRATRGNFCAKPISSLFQQFFWQNLLGYHPQHSRWRPVGSFRDTKAGTNPK